MRILWLLCLGTCFSFSLRGQQLLVVDGTSGLPVELALITAPSLSAPILTNAAGEANISALKGAAMMEVRSLGYVPVRLSFAEAEAARFIVRLQRDQTDLAEVIVAASRWGRMSRDVPARVSSISQRDIALQSPQTAADLLAGSGEIFVQKSQLGGGSPMIRGFATNRLLYAVDGVRMNTAIFRSGNIQNVLNLDPFATEHVEVVYGPGSVMYGSDAIGGVMSFQTLTPRFADAAAPHISGKVVLQTASANREMTGHLDLRAGWRKWALVTSMTSFDFQDLRMGSYGPEEYLRPFYVGRVDDRDVVIANEDPLVQRPTGYGQLNFMQKVRFRPATGWDLQYALHYSATTAYDRYDRHIRLRQGLPRSGEWSYGPQRWMLNQVTVTREAQQGLFHHMTGRLAYQRFEESRYDRDFQDTERRGRIEQVNAWSANLDFAKLGRAGWQLYYGLEGVLNEVTSAGVNVDIATGEIADGPSRYPRANWLSAGVYAQAQKRMNTRWLVQAGARYSAFGIDAEFDTRFYPFPFTEARLQAGAVSGSLGATYTPSADWTFRMNLSTGYRAPNVDDMGKVFDSEPGNVLVPNPALTAEYAYNAEAGAAWQVSRALSLDATVYYTLLDDALVRRPFQLNGMDSILYDGELSQVLAIQNAAQATVYGVQAGIDAQLGAGFYTSANINFQRGEEELDDGTTSPSRHAPPLFGRVNLGFKDERLQLVGFVMFSGERAFEDLPPEERAKPEIYAIDPSGRPWSPGWVTLNLRASYEIEGKFTFTAGMENITDRRYRPYSSGIVAPGRNMTLSVQVAL